MTDLPLLPGTVVKEVQSTASPRGMSEARPPIMVGEFRDAQGRDRVMLVNLSLDQSTNVGLTTVTTYSTKHVVSAEDGRLSPWDDRMGIGCWLDTGC